MFKKILTMSHCNTELEVKFLPTPNTLPDTDLLPQTYLVKYTVKYALHV